MALILFIPLCELLLLIEKSIALELSNPQCDGKECQRGEASGRRIDPEIRPHLTGSINSSIMMLSIAEVAGRTRGGQSVPHLLCQKLQRPFQETRHPSSRARSAYGEVPAASLSNHIKSR